LLTLEGLIFRWFIDLIFISEHSFIQNKECNNKKVTCILFSIKVMVGDKVYALDLAAKLDQTAEFLCKTRWGDIEFPPPFGRDAFPEVICT
jgi:hypothetical protein